MEDEKDKINPAEKETSEVPAVQEKAIDEVLKDVDEEEAPPEDVFFAKVKPRGQKSEDVIERVVKINRVAKVVKGGKNFSFNALVVVGDGKGNIGIGFGKSNEVVGAITKGTSDAKKKFQKVVVKNGTIPHEIIGTFKAAKVILKPAAPGTGVIAGGPVRALCDAAGIKNILTKSLGSRTPVNVVKAAMNGLLNLRLDRKA